MRMKTRLVQIGNSRGIRLSKPLLEYAALGDDVEIEAEPGLISIRSANAPRAGWAEAAASGNSDGAADEPEIGHTPTQFDDAEWEW